MTIQRLKRKLCSYTTMRLKRQLCSSNSYTTMLIAKFLRFQPEVQRFVGNFEKLLLNFGFESKKLRDEFY